MLVVLAVSQVLLFMVSVSGNVCFDFQAAFLWTADQLEPRQVAASSRRKVIGNKSPVFSTRRRNVKSERELITRKSVCAKDLKSLRN